MNHSFSATMCDPVFAPRMESCRSVTIPASVKRCRETGRIDCFRLNWKPGMPNQPHRFFDSDFAKVLEGMAYMLELHPEDKALAEELDRFVDLVISAQQPDGYLNSYFSGVEPEHRWCNLYNWHELYCAGQYVLTSSLDTLILGIGKQPELMVCLSSSPLCVCQTVDEQRILAEFELTD